MTWNDIEFFDAGTKNFRTPPMFKYVCSIYKTKKLVCFQKLFTPRPIRSSGLWCISDSYLGKHTRKRYNFFFVVLIRFNFCLKFLYFIFTTWNFYQKFPSWRCLPHFSFFFYAISLPHIKLILKKEFSQKISTF